MLLKIYRGIGPGTILVLLLTAMAVWMQPLLAPVAPSSLYDTDPMPLYGILLRFMEGKDALGIILIFILVLTLAIYLVTFNTRLFFINERTFLPASICILLSGFMPGEQVLNPVVPAALLLMIAIDRILSSYRKPGTAFNFFDASLLLSIGSLFYFNIIWFYLIVLSGMALIRTFNFREIIVSVFGLVAPYIVLYSYYYISGADINMLNELIIKNVITETLGYYWSPQLIVLSLLNGAIILVALFHLLRSFNTKKIKSRKTFSLLIWILMVTILIYFFVPAVSNEIIYVFMIPASYIISHFLVFLRNKKTANLIFAVLLLSVILIKVL